MRDADYKSTEGLAESERTELGEIGALELVGKNLKKRAVEDRHKLSMVPCLDQPYSDKGLPTSPSPQ
jgi:hypothetical protein